MEWLKRAQQLAEAVLLAAMIADGVAEALAAEEVLASFDQAAFDAEETATEEETTTVPGSGGSSGCFMAGTLVRTTDGTKEIQKVTVGDKVLSYNTKTSKWEPKLVEHTFIHQFKGDVITISVGDTQIEASGNHPIWVVSGPNLAARPPPSDVSRDERAITPAGRWVEARSLLVGDILLTAEGKRLPIKQLHSRQDTVTVYNIRVQDNHTYAVSAVGILVHNKAAQVRPVPTGGGNMAGGETTAENALTQAENYLGPNYKEIAPGVYRSADGTRQFRITDNDLSDPNQGPHVHFEAIGPDGKVIIENSHVIITNP